VGSGHRKHDQRLSRALQPAGDQESRCQTVSRSVLRAKSSRALEARQEIDSPSFPNASIGGSTGLTIGETGTGPPIKTFEGDAFGINSHCYLIARQLAAG